MSTKAASKSGEATDASKEAPQSFEDALHELESLVAKMEDGDLSLDESLKAFERGVFLTRQCQTALQAAELKVQKLTEDGKLDDFNIGDLDSA